MCANKVVPSVRVQGSAMRWPRASWHGSYRLTARNTLETGMGPRLPLSSSRSTPQPLNPSFISGFITILALSSLTFQISALGSLLLPRTTHAHNLPSSWGEKKKHNLEVNGWPKCIRSHSCLREMLLMENCT